VTMVARGRQASTIITVICRECGRSFSHTEALVQLLRLRGYHPPRRCAACREFARAEREAAEATLTAAQQTEHAQR